MKEKIQSKVLGWFILIIIVAGAYGIFQIYENIRYNTVTHEKYHIIANYTENEYTAEINGETIEVGSLDDVVLSQQYEGEMAIKIMDGEGGVVNEYTYNFDKKPGAYIAVISNEPEAEYCLYEKQIVEYYYEARFGVASSSSKGVISSIGEIVDDSNFVLKDKQVTEFVLFPGEYSGAKLPDELNDSDTDKVKGIFINSCNIDEAQQNIDSYLGRI